MLAFLVSGFWVCVRVGKVGIESYALWCCGDVGSELREGESRGDEREGGSYILFSDWLMN